MYIMINIIIVNYVHVLILLIIIHVVKMNCYYGDARQLSITCTVTIRNTLISCFMQDTWAYKQYIISPVYTIISGLEKPGYGVYCNPVDVTRSGGGLTPN